MKYIPLIELILLPIMILVKTILLNRKEIQSKRIWENRQKRLYYFASCSLFRLRCPVDVFLIYTIVMIHRQIVQVQEEIFLKNHYGKEYEKYCTRVRRYV